MEATFSLKPFAIVNISIILLLFADVKLPNQDITTETYDSTASVTKSYSGYKSVRGKETITVLYCSDHNYRIADNPDILNDINKGDTVKIKKSMLFSKASQIGIETEKGIKWYNLALISNLYITILLVSVFLVSAVYLLKPTKVMDIFLAFSCASVFFTSMVYIFYY